MASKNLIRQNLKSIGASLVAQGAFIFLLILSLRVVEFLCIKNALPKFDQNRFDFFYTIVQTSSLFTGLYLCSVGLVLALIRLRFKKFYHVLFTFFSVLVLLVFFSSTHFYYATGLLLDKVIFYFRISELLEIAGSETRKVSGELMWFYLFSILVFLLFIAIHFKRARGAKARNFKLNAIPFFIFILVFILSFVLPASELTRKLGKTAISKTYYFASSIIEMMLPQSESDKSFETAVKEYRGFADIPQFDLQNEFPLIRIFDKEKGDISTYFEPFDGPPNIVLIFSEGLSSSFSGEGAYYGNHTPHLDSLYKKGLYWPNAVSNSDRTHGIFANMLASMPHGFIRGALNYRGEKYPEHLSIPKYLIRNGYDAAFVYGGWTDFDNYGPYLHMNHVEKIYGENFFKNDYHTAAYKEGTTHTWGIPDITLFDLYFNLKPEHQLKSPFLSIVLSQSLHSPFKVPDHDKYLTIAKKRFDKVNTDKAFFERHKDHWTTIAYIDEAIGDFMNTYKAQPEYENTIFIITGDHNFFGLPLINDLDVHNVPLVIYSPKLKKPMKFQDIVAHTDIPASLIKLVSP